MARVVHCAFCQQTFHQKEDEFWAITIGTVQARAHFVCLDCLSRFQTDDLLATDSASLTDISQTIRQEENSNSENEP